MVLIYTFLVCGFKTLFSDVTSSPKGEKCNCCNLPSPRTTDTTFRFPHFNSPDLKRDNKNPWLTWDKSKKKIKKASVGERGVPVAGKAITPGIQWLCKQLIAGLDETSRLKNRIDCEKNEASD